MSRIYLNYYKSKNFGDALNPFLLKKIINNSKIRWYKNNLFYSIINMNYFGRTNYMIIGSILQYADKNTIVWGAGFISENAILKEKPKKILAVRGPLTRNKVLKQGFECPEIFGDPCLLLPYYYFPKVEKKYKLGLIPHYVDKDNFFFKKVKCEDILIIDIESGVENVIKQILSCEKIASSALHGLITADAYDIPSIWLKLSDKIIGEGFKFRDYFLSVNRKDVSPLLINESVTINDVYAKFTDYKIKIDVTKLLNACPFNDDAVLPKMQRG